MRYIWRLCQLLTVQMHFSTSFRGDKWAVQIHLDTLESINSEYNLITSSRDSDQSSTETERDQKVTRSLQIVIEESE